jgi:hypothetical protein
LNRVPRYVNWTAKKGLQKGASCFADSISAEPSQNSRDLSPDADTFRVENHPEIHALCDRPLGV